MPNPTARQKKAQFYFALGHQRRLKILDVLGVHPSGLTFEDLSAKSGIPEGSICHHLRLLCDVDLVSRTVRGRTTVYELGLPPRSLSELPYRKAA